MENAGHNKPAHMTDAQYAEAKRILLNSCRHRFYEWNGDFATLKTLAKKQKISETTLRHRLDLGWSLKDALTKPILNGNERIWSNYGKVNASAQAIPTRVHGVLYTSMKEAALAHGLPISSLQHQITDLGRTPDEAIDYLMSIKTGNGSKGPNEIVGTLCAKREEETFPRYSISKKEALPRLLLLLKKSHLTLEDITDFLLEMLESSNDASNDQLYCDGMSFKTLTTAARIFDISPNSLHKRISEGYSFEAAVIKCIALRRQAKNHVSQNKSNIFAFKSSYASISEVGMVFKIDKWRFFDLCSGGADPESAIIQCIKENAINEYICMQTERCEKNEQCKMCR